MRLLLLATYAAFSIAPMAFAVEAKCLCSEQCMTQCQNGDSKDCKCKHCDCAKTGKCSQGRCQKDHQQS